MRHAHADKSNSEKVNAKQTIKSNTCQIDRERQQQLAESSACFDNTDHAQQSETLPGSADSTVDQGEVDQELEQLVGFDDIDHAQQSKPLSGSVDSARKTLSAWSVVRISGVSFSK